MERLHLECPSVFFFFCRRQFDNVKRVFKVVEDMQGSVVQNIKTNFLLPEELARYVGKATSGAESSLLSLIWTLHSYSNHLCSVMEWRNQIFDQFNSLFFYILCYRQWSLFQLHKLIPSFAPVLLVYTAETVWMSFHVIDFWYCFGGDAVVFVASSAKYSRTVDCKWSFLFINVQFLLGQKERKTSPFHNYTRHSCYENSLSSGGCSFETHSVYFSLHFKHRLTRCWCHAMVRCRRYGAVVFIACIKFETGKKKLQYLTFPDFYHCAQSIMASWTYVDKGVPEYDDKELDREFLLDLRELRILLEKEKEHKQ